MMKRATGVVSRCLWTPIRSEIPAILNGYTRFQISAFSLDDPQSGYAKLYRLLTGQSTAQKAGLGELHKLPALPSRERETDFMDLINRGPQQAKID